MDNRGFAKIPRDIVDKAWYGNANTLKVYIELLVSAAWRDFEYNGSTLKEGQFITSLNKLAKRCQLSVQQTRTALSHLKSTNTITIETTAKFSIITIIDDTCSVESNKPANDLANNHANTEVNNRNRSLEVNKKEIKEIEEAPASPQKPITKDDLTAKYGEENVTLYETKFDNWAARKGFSDFSNKYGIIAKWLAEDNVQKPRESSFSMDSIMNKILERYKT